MQAGTGCSAFLIAELIYIVVISCISCALYFMDIDTTPHQELQHTHVVCVPQQTGCLLSESAASTDYTAVRNCTPCGLFSSAPGHMILPGLG
jgi:hypothetical protein